MSGVLTELSGSPGSPGLGRRAGGSAIEAVALAKRYGDVEAVRGVSFRVSPGRSSRSSGRTARARPPRSGCCARWPGRRAGTPHEGRVIGIVSEADLLLKEAMDGGHEARRTVTGRILHRRKFRKAAGVTAADLMTSPAVTVVPRTR
jgi:CBS domain-containing protein